MNVLCVWMKRTLRSLGGASWLQALPNGQPPITKLPDNFFEKYSRLLLVHKVHNWIIIGLIQQSWKTHFLYLTTGPFLASLKRLSNRRISQSLYFFEPKRGEDGTNSETFSHVKITSTQVIARLKARKKLSLMILLADFRGSEKRVAHALKNKKRNALVPLFYGFTRFLPYTVLTELIMLLSIPVANFQVRYTRSPKHKNWV